MTRFARGKGSKSSNEKVPEDATPWSELKKGMLMKQEVLNDETKKCVSLLKSKVEDEKPTEWAYFSDDNDDYLNKVKRKMKDRKNEKSELNSEIDSYVNAGSLNDDNGKRKSANDDSNVKKKKKKIKQFEDEDISAASGEIIKDKKKCKRKGGEIDTEDKSTCNEMIQKENVEVKDVAAGGKKKKRKKIASNTEINVESNQDDLKEKKGKKKKKKEEAKVQNNSNNVEEKQMETEKSSKKKKMKTFAGEKTLKNNSGSIKKDQGSREYIFKNGKKVKKSKSSDKLTINIGGEMVDIVKFQGFYVTKEDSERLKELRKKMAEKGIPEKQIEGAIKLERRRCEKALARMKKNVCFQCRKPGHQLSQCPQVQNSVDTSTGVCYKCGSTEHKAFTCKVTQGEKYPFAECFICKEKGHIARECPDNPRGLYPRGGCCILCGDVTHLKKDCPKRIAENEEKSMKLGMRDDRNIEGLDDTHITSDSINGSKQKKKTIRF